MKVLFLDFDGPLHPTSAVEGFVYRGQDIAAISSERRLFRWLTYLQAALAKESNMAIVVHSSWRRFLNNSQIREVLGPLGHLFIGITDVELGRYEGIMACVKRMELQQDDFIVVDDSRESFPEGFSPLVLVNPMRGVSEPAVRNRIAAWAQPAHTSQDVASADPSDLASSMTQAEGSREMSPDGSQPQKRAALPKQKDDHPVSANALLFGVLSSFEMSASVERLRCC